MQELLLKVFIESYYIKNYHEVDKHKLFAQLLSEQFDTEVTREQAENIAIKIAAEGVIVVRDDKGIREIIG